MLTGCRVLDLTTERGLLCGQIFGDLGADVIKIEPPGGSPARAMPPFFKDEPGPERSIYWWSYNRNKRGITLNLESEQGREILRRLAAKADFVIESDNPGDLARQGLAYSDLCRENPALIYVSITPFGQSGPKAGYADSDLIIMAAGGPLILYGDEDRPPIRMSIPQAYLHACVDGVAAALIAYYAQMDSGRGQQIDVAAQESVGLAAQSAPLSAPVHGAETRRMAGGAKMGRIRIPLVWPAKDGQVSCVFLFGAALGPFTRKLMGYLYAQGECDQATHDKDWIAYGDLLISGKEPMAEYDRMKGVVGEFLRKRTKSELFEIAREHNLLIAPVSTIDDVLQNPQFIAREYWQKIESQQAGKALLYPGPFARFGVTPITFRRRPPALGEHNGEVLAGELGMNEREVAELARKGII
jgi:crotonobetainyl-CoA:carnitine CoA-transferase CaiB-like acyl-CoA transferase